MSCINRDYATVCVKHANCIYGGVYGSVYSSF